MYSLGVILFEILAGRARLWPPSQANIWRCMLQPPPRLAAILAQPATATCRDGVEDAGQRAERTPTMAQVADTCYGDFLWMSGKQSHCRWQVQRRVLRRVGADVCRVQANCLRCGRRSGRVGALARWSRPAIGAKPGATVCPVGRSGPIAGGPDLWPNRAAACAGGDAIATPPPESVPPTHPRCPGADANICRIGAAG